jgi:hypothetical protein
LKKETKMKIFFAIFALIYFLLAKPISIESNPIRLFGLSNINCVMHCVQPNGKESDEESVQTRNIMSNYGTLYDCLKKCS